MAHTRAGAIASLLGPFLFFTSPVSGGELRLNGLTFSDEVGGFVLREGWGSGRRDDPFTLVEDIYRDGEAVLVIRGLLNWQGSGGLAGLPVAFALTKIVTNRTDRPWHHFEMELRQVLHSQSPNADGLSFAQAEGAKRRYHADRFVNAWQDDDPYDAVVFSGGTVLPGETVRMQVEISDFTPSHVFYLIQRRNMPIAALDGLVP